MVYGPYSADSFFGSNGHENFDAVLAAYHDQGLIPFKTLSFGKGVKFHCWSDQRFELRQITEQHMKLQARVKQTNSSFVQAVYAA